MLHISKSKYCQAVGCLKTLWMDKHMPEERDDSALNQAVLDMGSRVGDLAMGLFGDYVEVSFDREDLGGMIDETKRLMAQGTPVIAEASFSYNGAFCSVDILLNIGDGIVELYEVKSSTGVRDYHYDDVAFQHYVLTKLGYTVRKVGLVHINSQYVRHGEVDIRQLFTIEDLTDAAKQKLNEVENNLRTMEEYVSRGDEPADCLCDSCQNSKGCCVYWRYCSRHLPAPNVFDLSGMQMRTKLKYYRSGAVSFEQLENEGVNPKQLMQIRHELHDLPDHIDGSAIREFLGTLRYPLYFLDFESFNAAVPEYDDSRPYEQVVFQYSLLSIDAPGGQLRHSEFLGSPETDPRRGLAEQLCRDIPDGACTLAYNMTFERSRIRELAALYPDLSERLMRIHDGIADLMPLFQNRSYYNRAMHGSHSIKYVLPALFPEDESLNYANLSGVHNGAEASDSFLRMRGMAPDALAALREALLRYCELDTLAMVRIFEKLRQVAPD